MLARQSDAGHHAITSWPDALFGLCFGTSGETTDDPAIVHVPLRLLGGGCAWESWNAPAIVNRHTGQGICHVATQDDLVVHAQRPVAPDADVATVTRAAYGELLTCARALGYPHLARVWNFVPGINHGDGDDETYVRFNRGRAAVFSELDVPAARFPAATAVGSPIGAPLVVIVLASRHEPLAVENPRQISAYHYPRRYGQHSPAFARATILPGRTGGKLFISGTASIVGHESCHSNVALQLQETLRNLDELMAAASRRLPPRAIGERRAWRVYLRNPADLAAVERDVSDRLGNRDSVVFLQAEICRRELLIEIEGVCELVSAVGSPA